MSKSFGKVPLNNSLRKNKAQIQAEAEAEALEKTRKAAQAAFYQAQEEQVNNNPDLAAQWMERTHRLTKTNPNVMLSLAMMRLNKGDRVGAVQLIEKLMQRFDFNEGWLTWAAILFVNNQPQEALKKIAYALSKYAQEQARWELVCNLVQRLDQLGCCAVLGSMGEVWVKAFSQEKIDFYLDDQWIGNSSEERFKLPEGWEKYRFLRVEQHKQPLIGSPVDLKSIYRTEGFVEKQGQQITGWLWYPAEPERIPQLNIYDSKGKLWRKIIVTEQAKQVSLDDPLFRARYFHIPIEELPKGLIHLRDEYGKAIFGSPIDPTLEERAIEMAIAFHAPLTKKATIKYRDLPNFFPISASYQGKNPLVSQNKALGTVIIIPVYRGREITVDCIQSVMNTVPSDVIIQLIDDCSPDAALAADLDRFAQSENVKLIRHEQNKGFPGAVNSGLKAWPGYDVILLNSDTWVAANWLEGLQNAAYSEANIGTVTPFSNDASILSYPYHDEDNPVPSHKAIRHFMAYAKAANQGETIEIPTANGFCMFIRHDCLWQTGLLREDIFAQGYGEENDFCIRARHLGWKHVAAPAVFVGHQGSISFGNAKMALMERNLESLNRLYPGYHEMIMEFIDKNPLRLYRRRLDLKRWQYFVQQQGKKGKKLRYVLLITHLFGGGVERHVQERVQDLRKKGFIPLILRPTILGDGCRLEVNLQALPKDDIESLLPNIVFNLPDEYASLCRLLGRLDIVNVEWQHLGGHHPIIRNLCHDLGLDYDIYIHDYIWLCQRIALVGEEGRYCGEPDLKVCERCIKNLGPAIEEDISVSELIQRSSKEFAQARHVFAPSQDVAKRILKHFPHINTLQAIPLEDDHSELTLKQLSSLSGLENNSVMPKIGAKCHENWFRVCIIGAIGIEKGFEVIKALAQDAYDRNLPLDFVIVGRTADDEEILKTDRVFITGPYEEEEGIALVRAQHGDIAFFPAVWPETWCYALNIAWRAGLMTAAYDLGAIAERIRKTKRGWLFPLTLSISELNHTLLNLCKKSRLSN